MAKKKNGTKGVPKPKLTDAAVQILLQKLVQLVMNNREIDVENEHLDKLSVNNIYPLETKGLDGNPIADGERKGTKEAKASRKSRQRYLNMVHCIYKPMIKKKSTKPITLGCDDENFKNLYKSNTTFAEMDFMLRYKINMLKYPGGIKNTCTSKEVMPDIALSQKIDELEKALKNLYTSYIGNETPEKLSNQEVFDALQSAIARREVVKISHHHYNYANSKKIEYTIWPLKLFIERGYWYLAASVLSYMKNGEMVNNEGNFSDENGIEKSIESFKISNIELIEDNLNHEIEAKVKIAIEEIIKNGAFTAYPYHKRYTAYLQCPDENIYSYFKRKKYAPSQETLGNRVIDGKKLSLVVSFDFACYHEFKIIYFPWLRYVTLVGIDDEKKESVSAFEMILGKIEEDIKAVIRMHQAIHPDFNPSAASSSLPRNLEQHPSCR
ncbi:MAG: WYL domain-containing protein [Campylobacterales bacterium]|nr:WYL domain-containing protein [Campylobacterales bacterium]